MNIIKFIRKSAAALVIAVVALAGCSKDEPATAPTVVSITPADGATSVPTSGNIVITFSEAMDTTKGTVQIKRAEWADWNGPQEGGSWSNGNKTYTVPYSGPGHGENWMIQISGFIDVAGNAFAGSTTTFTTY